MTESEKEVSARKLRELEGKNIAHYSVFLGAWIETRMQRDKTLITLSAGGIGLLITLLTIVKNASLIYLILYSLAFGCFIGTIFICLKIYQENSVVIENEIRGPEDPNYKELSLKLYDKWSYILFVAGVILSSIMGLTSAAESFI